MSAKKILQQCRDYVAEHGLTGGYGYDGDPFCPRQLIQHFGGGQGIAPLFDIPSKPGPRKAKRLLDEIASKEECHKGWTCHGDNLAFGTGGYAEARAHFIELKLKPRSQKRAALRLFDRALAAA